MKRQLAVVMVSTLIAQTGSVHSIAAEDPAVLKDLGSVIALLGLPCGQVVSATRSNDKEQVATCQNGNRYRVFINAQGRVVAQLQP